MNNMARGKDLDTSKVTNLHLTRKDSVRDSWSGLGIKPDGCLEEQCRFIFVAKDLYSFPLAIVALIRSDNAVLKNGVFPRGNIAFGDKEFVILGGHFDQHLHDANLARRREKSRRKVR